jgi:hypothetical protein
MRDKRIPQNKRGGEPLTVVYSIKLTQSQRIALMRLGPQWMRNQIERSAEFCSLGTDNTGQVRPGRLPKTSNPAGGVGAATARPARCNEPATQTNVCCCGQ